MIWDVCVCVRCAKKSGRLASELAEALSFITKTVRDVTFLDVRNTLLLKSRQHFRAHDLELVSNSAYSDRKPSCMKVLYCARGCETCEKIHQTRLNAMWTLTKKWNPYGLYKPQIACTNDSTFNVSHFLARAFGTQGSGGGVC